MLPGMSAVPILVPAQPLQPQPLPRSVDLLVLHCSATPSGRVLGRGLGNRRRSAAAIIDGWHMQRGFARRAAAVAAFNPHLPHIGYHYVIDADGTVETGRGRGEVGAHVAGFNAHSIGICLVGGIERDARYTTAQWQALPPLLATLCSELGVPLEAPLYARHGHGLCGHRDLSPDINADGQVQPTEWLKTCPGFDVAAWLARGMQPLPEQVCEVVR